MTHYEGSPEQNSEVVEELVDIDKPHMVDMNSEQFSHLGEELAQARAAIAAVALRDVEAQFSITPSVEY